MNSFNSKVQSLKAQVVLARMLIAMSVITICSQTGFAQSTNAPGRLSYDSFRPISDRNIFNPNRYARGSGRTPPRTTAAPASRVESFSLVGIMAYEKGVFAFFDGTKDNYKQALQVEGAIGDYKVMSVTPEMVKLTTGTNTFDLKVGMQMRREDEGDWFLSEGGVAPRKRIVSTRTRVRGGARGESSTDGGTAEMGLGGEPEIIVIDGETQTENGNPEAAPENGNGTNPEAAPRPEPDNNGVTDPVLLRLMQRRQQMNQ